MKREIVVFATSLKHGQRCVAGKCYRTKEWIRPVSNQNGDAIRLEKTTVLNTKTQKKWQLKLLQRAEITFLEYAPLHNHQPENFIVSNDSWIDKYKIEKHDIHYYLDNPNDLWGKNDSVEYQNKQLGCSQQILASLYLVQVKNLNLYTKQFNDKIRRRASFTYKETHYDLAVTCLTFDDHIQLNNQYQSAILCISLGEPSPYDNRCYKLVASIFI